MSLCQALTESGARVAIVATGDIDCSALLIPCIGIFMLNSLRQHWQSNVRADVLSAIVVALALIPEAIAFSIIAGVDPKVGLYASFAIAVITVFVGGRPAMISAATQYCDARDHRRGGVRPQSGLGCVCWCVAERSVFCQ